MSERIKSIPTEYSGVKMRSRLEATAAQWFDRLKIKWLYEAEGFDIGGVWYLPDFWLPELQAFVEVKGVLDNSVEKTKALASRVGRDVSVYLASAEQVSSWGRGIENAITRLDEYGSSRPSEFTTCDVCSTVAITPRQVKHCFGIYLAGKVHGPGDWRHRIFPSLANLNHLSSSVVEWEDKRCVSIRGPLGDRHYYCGPYFAGQHLDSEVHKAGLGSFTKHDAEVSRRAEVFEMSRAAISRCDFVFGWIEDKTCYGTLVEIGMANALGKRVYIGEAAGDVLYSDLWFAREAASGCVLGATPEQAIQAAVFRHQQTWRG